MVFFTATANRGWGGPTQSWDVNLIGISERGPCYYIAVAGNTAYCGFGNVLVLLDITNKTNPFKIRNLSLPSSVSGIAVSGDYAYLANENDGLRIVDVSNPMAPVVTGYYETKGSAMGIAISGTTAYLADGLMGVRVIDVSSPSDPTEIGYYKTSSVSAGVAVSDHYAYLADGINGLWIIDVSNPQNPQPSGRYDTGTWALSAALSGSNAFMASGADGLRVIDISSKVNPEEIAHLATGSDAYSVAVSGNYAYVIDRLYGLRVVHFPAPARPVEVGYYNTANEAMDVILSGNHVFVADYLGGLNILEYDLPVKVLIENFQARLMDQGVALEWEARTDENLRGFQIARREVENEAFAAISTILPPHTGSFFDREALPPGNYLYILSVIREDGSVFRSQAVTLEVPSIALDLYHNHSNPFHSSTLIPLELREEASINPSVFDPQGKLIATLINGTLSAGLKEY